MKTRKLILDPRTKLFMLLLCVVAASLAPSLVYGAGLVVFIGMMGILCGYCRLCAPVCAYTVGSRFDGHTEDNTACCVRSVSQSVSVRHDGHAHYCKYTGERVFIGNEPFASPQKTRNSLCGYDTVFSCNPRRLAVYKRRNEDAGYFPLSYRFYQAACCNG